MGLSFNVDFVSKSTTWHNLWNCSVICSEDSFPNVNTVEKFPAIKKTKNKCSQLSKLGLNFNLSLREDLAAQMLLSFPAFFWINTFYNYILVYIFFSYTSLHYFYVVLAKYYHTSSISQVFTVNIASLQVKCEKLAFKMDPLTTLWLPFYATVTTCMMYLHML